MWQEKNNSLYKKFELSSFEGAVAFINQIFTAASSIDHHPKIINEYSTVELFLTTHSAGNKVTEKDHQLAKSIDEAYENIKI